MGWLLTFGSVTESGVAATAPEIWGCQQGIRVAAFNVGKDCTLVYPGYFMLSLNGGLLNANSHHMNKNTHQCFLINSDGILKTIHIPFHLILRLNSCLKLTKK